MTRDQAIRHNLEVFLNQGPATNHSYILLVAARDYHSDWALISGFGPCGVREIWQRVSDTIRCMPGYEDAPDRPFVGEELPFQQNLLAEHEAMQTWRREVALRN